VCIAITGATLAVNLSWLQHGQTNALPFTPNRFGPMAFFAAFAARFNAGPSFMVMS
jgi:hypothetical protein